MTKAQTYLGSMDYWHRNPPAPFNTLYNPNSTKALNQAVKELEAEGWYASTTLEERQATTVLHDRYTIILKELDK